MGSTILNVRIGDSERAYGPAPITMRMQALWKKTALEAGKDDPTLPDIVDYICDDEERLNTFLQMAYNGDHSGFSWFDVEREYIYTLVFFFATRLPNINSEKMTESLLSSLSTETKSTGTATKTPTTRSATKSKRGA